MIRVRRLREGRMRVEEGVAALRDVRDAPEPDWIAAIAPDEAEVRALCELLDLHPLAVRDALGESQPPKIDDYGEVLFFIVHTPVKAAYQQTRRVSVFLARTWIVTVQTTASDAMDEIARRVEAAPQRLLTSPDLLAHVVLDHMTSGFEALTAEVVEDLVALEDRVLGDPSPDTMEAILRMRRRVSGLLRVTRSQRDVCAALSRTPHEAVGKEALPYLRDVHDHILRVFELLESVREGLAVTRDAHLAAVNNRLSEIMRTLTIIATVMMPLSLLAGVYGMNFEGMPGVASPAGFWIVVAAMLAISGGMLLWFRRRGWF